MTPLPTPQAGVPTPSGFLQIDCGEELASELFQRLQSLVPSISMTREGSLVSYQLDCQ